MSDSKVSEERKQELLRQVKADTGPIIDFDKLNNIRYGGLCLSRRYVESKCAWTADLMKAGTFIGRNLNEVRK